LKQRRLKVAGAGYLSSHDPRMVLGLGKHEKLDWLEIKWPLPNGKVERFADLPSTVTSPLWKARNNGARQDEKLCDG